MRVWIWKANICWWFPVMLPTECGRLNLSHFTAQWERACGELVVMWLMEWAYWIGWIWVTYCTMKVWKYGSWDEVAWIWVTCCTMTVPRWMWTVNTCRPRAGLSGIAHGLLDRHTYILDIHKKTNIHVHIILTYILNIHMYIHTGHTHTHIHIIFTRHMTKETTREQHTYRYT